MQVFSNLSVPDFCATQTTCHAPSGSCYQYDSVPPVWECRCAYGYTPADTTYQSCMAQNMCTLPNECDNPDRGNCVPSYLPIPDYSCQCKTPYLNPDDNKRTCVGKTLWNLSSLLLILPPPLLQPGICVRRKLSALVSLASACRRTLILRVSSASVTIASPTSPETFRNVCRSNTALKQMNVKTPPSAPVSTLTSTTIPTTSANVKVDTRI